MAEREPEWRDSGDRDRLQPPEWFKKLRQEPEYQKRLREAREKHKD